VKEVIKKNCDCEVDFNAEPYASLPADARHLLQAMLTRDPSQRISAREALSHPFLAEDRKRLEIEMQSLYQTQNSIFA
jgi:serine/threonine protein kinase